MNKLFNAALLAAANDLVAQVQQLIRIAPQMSVAANLAEQLSKQGVPTEAHVRRSELVMVCLVDEADVGAARATIQDECRSAGLVAMSKGEGFLIVPADAPQGAKQKPIKLRLEAKKK